MKKSAHLPANVSQAVFQDLITNVLWSDAVQLGYQRHDTLLRVSSARLNYNSAHAEILK